MSGADRELVTRVADSLLDLDYETWNFGDSVAFEALVRASDVTGDERYAAFARGWGRSWATRRHPFRRLDVTAPGAALVELARRYDDRPLTQALLDLAGYLTARPRIRGLFATWESSPLMAPYGGEVLSDRDAALLAAPPPGAFLDCLHFDPPFLTALGSLVGDDELVGIGVEQACAYVEVLQRAEGDFAHFVLEGVEGAFGIGWGRGQGWALLGLLDVLEIVDTARPEPAGLPAGWRDVLGGAVRRLVDRMIGCQRPDGHWDAVLGVPGSGMEGSTAAFMADGFRRALALDLVDPAVAGGAQRRAEDAVRRSVDGNGVLGEVSVAVMAATVDSHYVHVPRGFAVPWGQGPALLALAPPAGHRG